MLEAALGMFGHHLRFLGVLNSKKKLFALSQDSQ